MEEEGGRKVWSPEALQKQRDQLEAARAGPAAGNKRKQQSGGLAGIMGLKDEHVGTMSCLEFESLLSFHSHLLSGDKDNPRFSRFMFNSPFLIKNFPFLSEPLAGGLRNEVTRFSSIFTDAKTKGSVRGQVKFNSAETRNEIVKIVQGPSPNSGRLP